MKLLLVTQTRNKKGQLSRAEQVLTADVFRIGRGTDCKLFLPDPRVALHHAVIRRGEDGAVYIEADAGAINVSGGFERSARLRPDQRILVGPYEFFVLASRPDVDLAMTIELVEPLREGVDEVRSHVRAGLSQTWLSKRAFSWTAAALILAVFLFWPALSAMRAAPVPDGAKPAALTPDASWDPGPLASAHASFGRDCGQCHRQPFVQVTNQACESCHRSIGWHFALDTPQAKAIHEKVFDDPAHPARCASCHRDHKGANGLVRTDATLCTDCHRNLKARHPGASLPDIADFAVDHPRFKLSMLSPGKTGKDAVVRVAQDQREGKLAERSGLKFPHDVHLDRKGVRGPAGRVVMECANCHAPDEAGLRFKPTTMKDHCQQCHSLEFEPRATTRQVPHGNVENVLATLNEFYAQAALADTPIDVVVDAGIRRPGERLSEGRRQAALAWATDKANKIAHDLFEDRVCFICHQITSTPKAGIEPARWQVAPVAVTQHWLPKSRFPHSQHNTFECAKCHDVARSKTSVDIAIPNIDQCRDCHGGSEPTRDKARGTCETCHGFHTGSHRAGVPPIVPGGGAMQTIVRPGAAAGGAGR